MALSSGKIRYPLHRGLEWAPGALWTCAENLAPTGIRSPYRPARSQSYIHLAIPAHSETQCTGKMLSVKAMEQISWKISTTLILPI